MCVIANPAPTHLKKIDEKIVVLTMIMFMGVYVYGLKGEYFLNVTLVA